MRPFFATVNGIKVLVVNSFTLLYNKDLSEIDNVRFLVLNYGVGRGHWQLVGDKAVKFERFASDGKVDAIMDAIKQDERKKVS